MTPFDFLLPVFAQVALTFGLMFWMANERIVAIRNREVRVSDIALGQPAWPAGATKVANAYHNQLQLPVLFYVVVAFILITNTGNTLLLILAWLFVASRYAHAFVHTTSNRLPGRFYVFVVGALALLAMWVIFAIRILAAPALASAG